MGECRDATYLAVSVVWEMVKSIPLVKLTASAKRSSSSMTNCGIKISPAYMRAHCCSTRHCRQSVDDGRAPAIAAVGEGLRDRREVVVGVRELPAKLDASALKVAMRVQYPLVCVPTGEEDVFHKLLVLRRVGGEGDARRLDVRSEHARRGARERDDRDTKGHHVCGRIRREERAVSRESGGGGKDAAARWVGSGPQPRWGARAGVIYAPRTAKTVAGNIPREARAASPRPPRSLSSPGPPPPRAGRNAGPAPPRAPERAPQTRPTPTGHGPWQAHGARPPTPRAAAVASLTAF